MKFNLNWRVPCAIYFIRRKITKYHDIKVEFYIDGVPGTVFQG